MSHDAKIQADPREKMGSRQARKLRNNGRIPCSLQFDGEVDQPVRHFHLSKTEFMAGRRREVHLWDITVDGGEHSAIVRELQWGAMGDVLTHIDFKGVHRGQKTEVEVPITTFGDNAGVVNLIHNSIKLSCLPSQIPDSVVIRITDLEIGIHMNAADLTLPEGSELTADVAAENSLYLTISEETVTEDPVEGEDEGEEGGEPEVIGEDKPDDDG
jgi:large subunit ribosomal protein L25